MTVKQRFALGLLGCVMVFTDVFLMQNSPLISSFGALVGCSGGAIAMWQALSLLKIGRNG